MKQIITAFLLLKIITPVIGQTYIEIKEKDLYDCSSCPIKEGRPKFTAQLYKTITLKEASSIFDFLKHKSQIEFNYPQGNCDDRAHAMCLLLDSLKISNFKIWNFAPSKTTLLTHDLLKVKDKNNFDPDGTIAWGYHVAPAIWVTNPKGGKDTIVLDPSLFNTPVKYSTWLNVQGSKASLYTFLDNEWYLFYTLNGFTAFDNEDFDNNGNKNEQVNLPAWFPSIMTGDFYVYQGQAKTQFRVSQGLAINEAAYSFYKQEVLPILNNKSKSEILSDYKLFAGSVTNFETVILNDTTNAKMTSEFKEKYKDLMTKYKTIYLSAFERWKTREQFWRQ